MKNLTLFYLETCPHCIRAQQYMKELCDENPAYAEIPVRRVEERKEKNLADSYDYFYVPTYYVDDEKVSEGSVNKDDVRKVFDIALEK